MQTVQDGDIDAGRSIDWGEASRDYARYRPDPPQSLFDALAFHGIGVPGQRILDLGTGTGALARQFAKAGASVTGTDIAKGQIAAAIGLATDAGLDITFRVAASENTGLADNTFDVITANQCWLYFDQPRVVAEAARMLRPGGCLVISHFSYLPRKSAIAAASEAVVLRHNPDWQGADLDGVTRLIPKLPGTDARLELMLSYDEDVRFTAEAWRGRMRALRGIGAALSADAVARFDADHAAVLAEIAGADFTIPHLIDAHVFRFASGS